MTACGAGGDGEICYWCPAGGEVRESINGKLCLRYLGRQQHITRHKGYTERLDTDVVYPLRNGDLCGLDHCEGTVAIRYATVRRQCELGPDGLERQTIPYPSLHVCLVPLIARAYVFTLTRGFDSLARELSSGDTSQLPEMLNDSSFQIDDQLAPRDLGEVMSATPLQAIPLRIRMNLPADITKLLVQHVLMFLACRFPSLKFDLRKYWRQHLRGLALYPPRD
ncbi:hypothetical protein B0H13DRAFT_1873252 [Mycena leptocephala]|nr:hypothetical protein B0H13DRAFT_1873252 [Mycena leptocephala]